MRRWAVFLFFLSASGGFCQLSISGTIYDKGSRQPIAFVSIGISGKPVGTLSSENGTFTLKLGREQMTDSIRIAAISYKPMAFLAADLAGRGSQGIFMEPLPQQLEEVVIKSKKINYRVLGTTHYSKNNCSGFTSINGNAKGSETAIFIKNKKTLLMEAFSFYVIQNNYADSVPFRLMFYSRASQPNEQAGWIGTSLMKKPVIFKVSTSHGVFTLPLRQYSIMASGDFFISLECLVDDMDIGRFCHASSSHVPGYFKVKSFAAWFKNAYGGADFNVKVSLVD